MKRLYYIVILLAGMTIGHIAKADEGMWMINLINEALEKNMQERGLELSANEIYNADAPGTSVSDAVVSMEFGCTGSIISDQGLLITNHHCAYGDIHALSTPEHNYLEEGFWAMNADEEINIKDKSVYFLKKVIDVTDEAKELMESYEAEGKFLGGRKLSYLMETRYGEQTGLEAWFASMWGGSKYYIALYEVYSDVRIVAAPPVSAAAFGGDVDNWEWPQHKCDFAMYRVYTAPDGSPAAYSPDNIPMKPAAKLKISLDGYQAGDFTMVIGYPGRTNRYSSSFEVAFDTDTKLPINNSIRGKQMEIIKKWMDADPEIRLKYADYFFSLSNVQELYSGQVACCKRFGVVEKKQAVEQELAAWIATSPERTKQWGDLLESLERNYEAIAPAERNASYYRETLIRGSRLSNIIRRAFNARNPDGTGKRMMKEYEAMDLRVEHDLMEYAIGTFIENIDPKYFTPWMKELMAKFTEDGACNTKALVDSLWSTSLFSTPEGIERMHRKEVSHEEITADPLGRFIMEVNITSFNNDKKAAENGVSTISLDKEFTHALYQMRLDKGEPQYPDANSTMRITYGTVGQLEPCDGMICDWKTTPAGILEKYNPSDYDFHLNDRQYLLYRSADWGRWGFGPDNSLVYVNFLTDNDITGGNSGSPVMNSKGELIGLAFDGNKESLTSDVWCEAGYNKCVCVDIRFILWTLDRYAGMTRIIEEIGL
ncbi:MAG: S46 family peptidase [Bacteroidales bacterium]|nr:S46 family peptidase [Bacteroidales bacterium]